MWQIKRRYTLMAFASLKPDYFVQLPYQTTERMAVIMKETNFDYSNSYGLQASVIFNAGKWLNGNVFAVGTYKHDKSSNFFDLPFKAIGIVEVGFLHYHCHAVCGLIWQLHRIIRFQQADKQGY